MQLLKNIQHLIIIELIINTMKLIIPAMLLPLSKLNKIQ